MYFAGDIKLGNMNLKDHLMPRGTIVVYNGNTSIPYGWAICNGTKGTPDLRGRFILGEGGNKRLHSRGGEKA